MDVRSEDYKRHIFERLIRDEVLTEEEKEKLFGVFKGRYGNVAMHLKEKPPWKPLYVYEHVMHSLNEAIKPFERDIRRNRLSLSDRPLLELAMEAKETFGRAQIIHLSQSSLEPLYEHQHSHQPYAETVRMPFPVVFFEFPESLKVEAVSTLGASHDYLVGILCEEEDERIRVQLIWEDLGITRMQFEAKLLPAFIHVYCGLPENPNRPKEFTPCAREYSEYLYPDMAGKPYCPGSLSLTEPEYFPCIHNKWRGKLINFLINILNLLNAKNFHTQEVPTSKKRARRAQKDGIRLPKSYRRAVLDWFSTTRSSSGRGDVRGADVSRPYYRRGHFRQYKPGKFTWIQPHVCRADIKGKDVERRVYRA